MNTSQTDDAEPREHPVLLRVFLVAGSLIGFGVLALLMSGTANASEGSQPDHPDRPGLLSAVGKPLHGTIERVDPVLRPVTDVVHAASSQIAPVVEPVADLAGPVLAPVTRPVTEVAASALSVLRPVTEPVLRPVLDAVAPVTKPVVHAVGADPVVEAVAGKTAATQPREDVRPAPATVPVATTSHLGVAAPVAQPRPERTNPVAAHRAGEPVVQLSGSDGGSGGVPPASPIPGTPGLGGTMSAGSSGPHGGEYAVTTAGTGVPGVDRSWRAPPAGSWSLHWLEFYGNDHPS